MNHTTGVKFDAEKPRFDLLPPHAMEELAAVYTFGAKKYADRNWELGMDYGRLYAAAQRHMTSFWSGQDSDPDNTGLHNLAQAAFCILALLEYRLTGAGTDTRTKLRVPVITNAPIPIRTVRGPTVLRSIDTHDQAGEHVHRERASTPPIAEVEGAALGKDGEPVSGRDG